MKNTTTNVHAGTDFADPTFGSVVPPIYPSSTYQFPDARTGAKRFAGEDDGMVYGRFTNPTVRALEMRLAALEGAERAVAMTSGMSAITITLLHFLKAGDSIIAHRVIYGGAYEFIANVLPKFGIKSHMVDCTNLEEIKSHIDETTKIIFFETPTNPLLEVLDIAAIAQIGKEHGIMTILDGSFAPPPMQCGIQLGIDLVIHSLTKYISGHSDLIGGAVIGSNALLEPLVKKSYPVYGPTLSPFAAYLIMRGMVTMDLRMQKQNESAMKIAHYLKNHSKIERVLYPGLPEHPGHRIAASQMKGFGGVMSFVLKDGYAAGEKMANSVKLFTLAVSLGSVESLIQHPASMTHAAMGQKGREAAGIYEGLIRISVGVEDAEDLIADLEQALA